MIDSNINEVVQHLDFIGQDQALLSQFIRQNPDFMRWCDRIADRQHEAAKASLTPFPALDTLCAVEATVFDNGDVPTFRHRLTLKAYSGSQVTNWKRPAWQATATLWPHDVALKQATRSKAKFSDGTLAVIEEFAAAGSGFIGVFMHTGAGMGSRYNDLHVVWADLASHRAMIYTGEAHFWLAPFETTDARGKALTKNAALHSRSSSHEGLAHWATGEASLL